MAIHGPDFWKKNYSGQIAGELDDASKKLRDDFIDEYMFDEDPVKAACRLGFVQPFAHDYGIQFLYEPYVAQEIKRRKQGRAKQEAQSPDYRTDIYRTLHEAMLHGPYPSRVAATRAMMVAMGIDGKGGGFEDDDMPMGGIMVAPGIGSIDEWQQAALDMQAKLVDETQ